RGAVPEAVTLKVAVCPAVTVWFAGCVVMLGGTAAGCTVTTSVPFTLARPSETVTFSVYDPALEKEAVEISEAVVPLGTKETAPGPLTIDQVYVKALGPSESAAATWTVVALGRVTGLGMAHG